MNVRGEASVAVFRMMSALVPIQSIPASRSQLNSTGGPRPKRAYRGKPKGRPRGQSLLIADRALLKELVAGAVEREYGGSVRAAADKADLDDKVVSMIMAGKKKELAADNYIKLHILIPEREHSRLWNAFVPEEARALSRGFEQWLETSDRMASLGVGVRWTRTAVGFAQRKETGKVGKTCRDVERMALWDHFKTCRPLTAAKCEAKLSEHPDAPVYGRVVLARILDPLLNSAASGFREPSWRELRLSHPSRLVRFIELGITREGLLFRTELAMKRLLHVLQLQPQEMREAFGEGAVE